MLGVTALVLIGLVALSVPVAAALGILGLVLDNFYSFMPLSLAMGEILWQNSTEYILIAIPLFILLGEILLRSGIAPTVYAAIAEWHSWPPRGLLHPNIGAFAMFAPPSGPSVAPATPLGTTAHPTIRRPRYAQRLSLDSN